jgi:uncharacterized membrane protein YgdD (TMEM256/DUF423 family)
MYRTMLRFAALSGALTVILGAMGAHLLREKFHLDEQHLQTFETAVRYQAYHTLALLGLSMWVFHFPSRPGDLAGKCFIAGMFLFSGSLYFLALRPVFGISNDDLKWVGAITPLGGLAFIAGWILLFVYALKLKK